MRNKILSLLVLLLTAATGAWADKVQENISILAADWNAGSGTNVTNNGDLMKVLLTSEWGIAAYAWAQPVDLSNCDKLVVVVANMNGCDGEHYKLKAFLRDETNNEGTQMEAYVGLDDADNLQNEMVFDFTQQTSLDLTKVKKLGIQCQPNGAEYKISRVYIEKEAPKAAIEVTTNAASEGATFTEASFQMPAFDATAEYELVRDMSYGIAFSGVPTRARLAKDGNGKFHFADGLTFQLLDNIDAANPKDITSAEGITFMIGEMEAFDIEGSTYYRLNKETLVPLADFLNDAKLGNYTICAVAASGEYDGTFSSGMIKLFQGYEVEVAAKEFVTYYKDEPLYADTETSADAQLYTIQSVSGDQAQLSAAIQTAPSYTPLLIFNNSDQAKTFLLIPAEAEPSPISYYGGFIGTTDNATILASTEGTTNYALNGKAFVFVKNDLAIGPNKAWLSISNSNARTINLVFDETTKITNTNLTNLTNGDWYDLNGRKLNGMPTKKGVYILNGRKVVVK